MKSPTQLARMDVASISDLLLDRWRFDLTRAVRGARQLGIDGVAVCESHLAWTVAWQIEAGAKGHGPFARLQSRFPDLAELRAVLTAPLQAGDDGSFPLLELLCSLACELRDDWHDPRRPIHADERARDAGRALARLWELHGGRLEALCRSLGHPSPEELASDAWSGIFESYWSPVARQRWGGLSRISTLVMTAARRLHWKSRSGRSLQEPGHADRVGASLGMPGPDRAGLMAAYTDCRDALPIRQRLCVELLIQQQLDRAHIAVVLGCGRPNVTQLLDRGLASLRACMQGKGFGEG